MVSRTARRVVFALALSSSLLVTAAAGAQSLADRETARALMDEGDAKRDAKDYKAALSAYEKADAIMHVPTTGLEVARMQAQLGLLLEARETLARVIRSPVAPKEPAPFTNARKAAEQLNEELGRRVPALQLEIKGAPTGETPQVTIDGENVPAAVLSVPRKVNPGTHVVVVQAGSLEKSQDVLVAEKETKTVTIDLTPEAVAETPQVQTTDEPSEGGSSAGKVLMFGGFTVAAIGIGVGAVTGIMSMSKVDEIKGDCQGDRCPTSRAGDIDDAKSLGNISTIAFAAGGVGAAVGILGLIMSSGSSEQKPGAEAARPHTRAVVGPSYLGLSGTF